MIVAGVAEQLPSYLQAGAARVLDAWGRLTPDARSRVDDDLAAAVRAATDRVVGDLRALLEADPPAQRATPLQVVRDAVREPTAVLADAGLPDVVRDHFEERSFPLDRYGLAPRTFADLGDDELGPAQLAWGMAKAAVLRASPDHPR
jgi:hypothetical protein